MQGVVSPYQSYAPVLVVNHIIIVTVFVLVEGKIRFAAHGLDILQLISYEEDRAAWTEHQQFEEVDGN